MANNKGKIKVKVEAKKAVKPKMGRGTGGAITAKLIATVNKSKDNG